MASTRNIVLLCVFFISLLIFYFFDGGNFVNNYYYATESSSSPPQPRQQSSETKSDEFAVSPKAIENISKHSEVPIPTNDDEKVVPSIGNRKSRGVIALFLTHGGFHGVGLVQANIHGWIQNLILPQKNIDLVLFYDRGNLTEKELVSKLKLNEVADIENEIAKWKTSSVINNNNNNTPSSPFLRHNVIRDDYVYDTSNKQSASSSSSSITKHHKWFTVCSPTNAKENCILISLVAVDAKWPPYLQDPARRTELLVKRKDWLRCGCPPYCPVRKATAQYVQGTRWYTYDIFFEADGWIAKKYDYWVKMDVDIGFFRPLPSSINLIDEMESKRKIFLHTGYTYNGGGCSNNLHKSIAAWCANKSVTPRSGGEKWWKQDDNVYYSNFVISSVKFHTSPRQLDLARFLNDDVEEGFFKHRWTDQSLFHKVFGVFEGPKEEDFLLDFSWMRCAKKKFSKNAVFYHSKKGKSRSELAKCTRL